jgi:hypothetical protein
MSIRQIKPVQTGVCLFTDMIEWLRSDFEDDPIVDTKAKSIAATASAMIRKDKQMAAAQATTTTTTTTVQENTSIAMKTRSKTVTKEQVTTTIDDTQTTTTTATESQCLVDVQTENGSMLDAMEQLAMIDDGASSIGNAPSQQSWDDIEDLIEKI